MPYRIKSRLVGEVLMWNPFKLIKKPFSWAWDKAKKKLAMMLIKRIIKEIKMDKFMEAISGYKTYITAFFGVVLTGLLAMGIINQEVYNIIITILGFLGISFVRAGMKKK